MPSYKELFDVHLKFIDYIRAKSHVVHQYTKNISVSGSGVEVEVRALLRSVLPQRFHVTSGYIVRAANKTSEPSVSPQVDVIIVDTMVAHSLWLVDQSQGIEIVPAEAVVGVFEVKRTLGLTELRESVEHLAKVIRAAGLGKADTSKYMPGGLRMGAGLQGGFSANPLVGIIGLQAGEKLEEAPIGGVVAAIGSQPANDPPPLVLDMVLCLSGLFVAPGAPNTTNYDLFITQPATTWACASQSHGRGGSVALAQGLGYMLAYLSGTVGLNSNPENYFFNEVLWRTGTQIHASTAVPGEGTEGNKPK